MGKYELRVQTYLKKIPNRPNVTFLSKHMEYIIPQMECPILPPTQSLQLPPSMLEGHIFIYTYIDTHKCMYISSHTHRYKIYAYIYTKKNYIIVNLKNIQ